MLQNWYLVPASVNFLAEIILSLVIALYLTIIILRLRSKNVQRSYDLLIVLYFWLSVIINSVSFVITLRSHSLGSSLFILRDPFHILGLILLLHFAYRFPLVSPRHTSERRLAFILTGLYELMLIGSVLRTFGFLHLPYLSTNGVGSEVAYILILVWIQYVFVRQQIETANLTGHWWQVLKNLPENTAFRVRVFGIVVLIYFSLGPLKLALASQLISTLTFDLTVTNLMLVALLLMATIFLDSLPGHTTFMAKLVGTSMLTSYSIIAAAGWLMLPTILNSIGNFSTFQTARTLQFQPNADGGYQVITVPFRFETALGTRLTLSDENIQEVSTGFSFPFFGTKYERIGVSDNGFVTLKNNIGWFDRYSLESNTPKIIVFLMDLDPQTKVPGGVYVRRDVETMVVTWNQLAMRNGQQLTFQLVLHAGGQFELSYKNIPLTAANLLEIPNLNSITGIVNGNESTNFRYVSLVDDLPIEVVAQSGLLDNTYLKLREITNNMLLPLVYLLIIASPVNFIIFPLFSWLTFLKPLDTFILGVRRVNDGDLTSDIPIQTRDEIGFLSRSFNSMVADLREMVATLELRVNERTRELADANLQLLEEIRQREATEEINLQQQRLLVMLDERERLARDLHDGLGQAMGYINVETQAALDFITKGDVLPARSSLEKMSQMAQMAHSEIRNMIIGLRGSKEVINLHTTLELYMRQLHDDFHIQTSLSLPHEPLPELPAQIEEQILRVIQEALTNVRKHANATKVEIIFSYDPERLHIIIMDDGQGFELDNASQRVGNGHFGLEIMRERTRLVGGSLDIRSHLGMGTRVLLEFPLQLAQTSPISESDIIAASKLRLLLVDDSPLFLDGLRNLLLARGLIVVGEANNGADARVKVRELHPDVVVMDINMPNGNGLETTRAIKSEFSDIKVLILTTSDDQENLLEAIKSGAEGYLLKSLSANEFVRQLIGLSRGATPLNSELALSMIQKFEKIDPAGDQAITKPFVLSERQLLILESVSRGFKYKEIALKLNLSEVTIKREMSELMKSLNIENRREAINYLRQVNPGTFPPPPPKA